VLGFAGKPVAPAEDDEYENKEVRKTELASKQEIARIMS